MKSEYKKIWLEALRSGDYKQAVSVLHDADAHVLGWKDGGAILGKGEGYCCLGVLASEMLKHGVVDGLVKRDENGELYCAYNMHVNGRTYDGKEHCVLTAEVLEISGLDKETQDTLSSMNDSGKSFDHIADYIETHL